MSNDERENRIEESAERKELYSFGEYTLDPAQRVLLRFGKKIHLKPKTFEVLEYLLERADRVVLKNDILEAVWNDAFVEESNLTVQISVLRKIFGSNGKSGISIETIPKVGYRLNVNEGKNESTVSSEEPASGSSPPSDSSVTSSSNGILADVPVRRAWKPFLSGLVAGVFLLGSAFLILNGKKPFKHHTFKTMACPREAPKSNLIPGGCDDAVVSFNVVSNPNGNWSYGYTTKDDPSNFVLYTEPVEKNHYYSPELPTEMWRRPGEWHPEILHNASPLTLVIKDVVVVPPHMFEMHPGPKGERSVLRWTAPVDGSFLLQGQFRGLNTNGDTTTDVMVTYNNRIYFSDNVIEYNRERPFEVNFKMVAGETVDISVGYGSNEAYECDSTGVSVMVTTMALTNS